MSSLRVIHIFGRLECVYDIPGLSSAFENAHME